MGANEVRGIERGIDEHGGVLLETEEGLKSLLAVRYPYVKTTRAELKPNKEASASFS